MFSSGTFVTGPSPREERPNSFLFVVDALLILPTAATLTQPTQKRTDVKARRRNRATRLNGDAGDTWAVVLFLGGSYVASEQDFDV